MSNCLRIHKHLARVKVQNYTQNKSMSKYLISLICGMLQNVVDVHNGIQEATTNVDMMRYKFLLLNQYYVSNQTTSCGNP